jgi:autotransporter-associated beta strand protein
VPARPHQRPAPQDSPAASTARATPAADFTPGAGTGEIAAVLAGDVGLVKNSTGTLTLSGNNLYTGTTTVAVGVLRVASGLALGGTTAGTPAVVRVVGFEETTTSPDEEPTFGRSRIPERYNDFYTSGVTVEVVAGMGPVTIELTSR